MGGNSGNLKNGPRGTNIAYRPFYARLPQFVESLFGDTQKKVPEKY
jgi:hypothetical protein